MPMSEDKAVSIKVKSDDPKKDDDPTPIHSELQPVDDLDNEEDLSEEDRKLKDDLDVAVERICDTTLDSRVHKLALECLRTEIRTATSSMTSVPKPLKFLNPQYRKLVDTYKKYPEGENKKDFADVLSVMAMTMGEENARESLRLKLQGHPTELGEWGHEFVRSLAGEVGQEYNVRTTSAEAGVDVDMSDLMVIVESIVPFHIQHNAEPEAVDILIEVQRLGLLVDSKDIDESSYKRICLYLLSCADYLSDPDDLATLLRTAYELYKRTKQYPDAARVAIRLGDTSLISELFGVCADSGVKKQMACILGRHRLCFDYEEDETINDIISNTALSEQFLALARELDVIEAKTPEDIYKSHLAETGSTARSRESGQTVDSACHNLASTFVNAFVNAGYGTDKLMTPEGNAWLYKNKDHGMVSAAASLGMIMLWNVEEGLTQIDKFLYSGDENIKVGAVLAVGIVSCGVRNDCDPALALLSEHIESGSTTMKCAACVGLGMAYGGTARDDVADILLPVVANTNEKVNMMEISLAALSLGVVFVGTCNEQVGSVLMQRLMESSKEELEDSTTNLLCLGLGLLFLNRQEMADAMLEAVKTIEHKISKYASIALETCAYAGTGNVLKVQEMLHICAEHLDEDADHQSVAVLGIALVTVGENIGAAMAIRAFDHLLQYGDVSVRRAVPLALALLHISNPDYQIVDTLSRLSHDGDAAVAQGAILSLGLISAGTNNSRVAGILRQLSEFYNREANHLFIVRIAQGLLHMGKGLITLHPFHSDRLLLSGVGLAGILTVLYASLDIKNTILDKMHYLLYYVVTAMSPRMLITADEEMKPLQVTVRVGQAMEVVGQAGKPKAITGFQTHTTPVLLNVQERAELATDEYLALTNILEGIVVLRKNPDFVPDA